MDKLQLQNLKCWFVQESSTESSLFTQENKFLCGTPMKVKQKGNEINVKPLIAMHSHCSEEISEL